MSTYTWNEFDKLVRVDLPDGREVRFVYGSDGLRRERVEEGVRVNYLLDGLVVLCEFVDSGDVIREYVPGVSVSSGGSNFFYHYDRLGSVRFMSDSSGQVVGEYVYDAWGNVLSSSGSISQPYQFVGREGYYREGDLYLLGQRWYDNEVGRFISRDPIGYKGGLNLYEYVRNNPQNKIDVRGEDAEDVKKSCNLNNRCPRPPDNLNMCCTSLHDFAIENRTPPQTANRCATQCIEWAGINKGAVVARFAECIGTDLFREAIRQLICRSLRDELLEITLPRLYLQ